MGDIVIKHKRVYIDPTAMRKIEYYTEAAPGEVSGLGIVDVDKDGDMIISQVYLLDQESSSGDTELDGEAISTLMHQLITENKDPSKLKFWWHSHGSMGVFWSGTDHACADVLSKEYAISMVVNKQNKRLARLDIHSPIRITIDNIEVKELVDEDEELKKQCFEEVKQKVRTSRTVYVGGFRGGYQPGHYLPRSQGRGRGPHVPQGYQDMDGHWIDDWNDEYPQATSSRDGKVSQIKPVLLNDIERMEDLNQKYGVMNKLTVMEFIKETFLDIARERFKAAGPYPSVNCGLIGTYEDGPNNMLCSSCKEAELCKRIRNMIKETNRAIAQEKEIQEKHTLAAKVSQK